MAHLNRSAACPPDGAPLAPSLPLIGKQHVPARPDSARRKTRLRGPQLVLALSFCCAACVPYGDGADATRQHRERVAERTRDMRAATAQVARGQDLAGDSLRNVLVGRTWVVRYRSFPGGRQGDYTLYRHFEPDGRLRYIDNWLSPTGTVNDEDRWEVDGARLCLLQTRLSQTPSCYRVAQAAGAALQLYVDEPGVGYDGLLTSVISEFIDGPPPVVRSVLESPLD